MTVDETINRAPITVDPRRLNKAFVPDTAFAFPVRDDASADVFLQTHGRRKNGSSVSCAAIAGRPTP